MFVLICCVGRVSVLVILICRFGLVVGWVSWIIFGFGFIVPLSCLCCGVCLLVGCIWCYVNSVG